MSFFFHQPQEAPPDDLLERMADLSLAEFAAQNEQALYLYDKLGTRTGFWLVPSPEIAKRLITDGAPPGQVFTASEIANLCQPGEGDEGTIRHLFDLWFGAVEPLKKTKRPMKKGVRP